MSTDPAVNTQTLASAQTQRDATAMTLASKGIRSGAADAQRSAQLVAETTARAVSKTIYTTCYCMSYGIMFPTFLVLSFVPKDNVICHGLVDGAQAAADSVHKLRDQWAGKIATSGSLDSVGGLSVAPVPA